MKKIYTAGILVAVLVLIAAETSATPRAEVCPSTGDWTKDESAPFEVSRDFQCVVEACVKGGLIKEHFTENGSNENWAVTGIGGGLGVATNLPDAKPEISHASFRFGECEVPDDDNPTDDEPTDDTPNDTPDEPTDTDPTPSSRPVGGGSCMNCFQEDTPVDTSVPDEPTPEEPEDELEEEPVYTPDPLPFGDDPTKYKG